jgi:hypothetical protein
MLSLINCDDGQPLVTTKKVSKIIASHAQMFIANTKQKTIFIRFFKTEKNKHQ